MWRVTVGLLIAFSVFGTADFRDHGEGKLEKLVNKNLIKSKQVDSHKCCVYVWNSVCYEIFLYDDAFNSETNNNDNDDNNNKNNNKNNNENNATNTLIKFYTSMSCEFSTWTRNALYDLVQLFPVVYVSGARCNTFRDKPEKVEVKLHRIADEIDRYIDMLFNVTDELGPWTVDESVVTALLDLRFKIAYLRTLGGRSGPEADDGRVDTEAVRTVFRSIRYLEIFMSLNCGLATFYDDKLNKEVPVKVNAFLLVAEPLRLERAADRRCSLARTLLSGVLDDGTAVLRAISSVEISAGCGRNVLLKDVLDRVRTAHDVEVVYWYQRFVLRITMGLLCDKIVRYLSGYSAGRWISTTVRNPFLHVSALFVPDAVVDVPAGVIECFELFATKASFTTDDKQFMVHWINVYSADLAASVNLDWDSYHEDNKSRMDESAFKALLDMPLDKYLDAVVRRVDEYKCFVRLYRLLNQSFRSYYLPFGLNYEKITNFVVNSRLCVQESRPRVIEHLASFSSTTPIVTVRYDDPSGDGTDAAKRPTKSSLINEGCAFVKALIYYCFDVIQTYARDESTASTKVSDPDTLSSAFDALDQVRAALLAVAKIYPNNYFRKIAYQVIPYFTVLDENTVKKKYATGDAVVRVVSLFVNLLNDYGLEFCYPPQHPFLIFNRELVKPLASKYLMVDEVKDFLSIIKETKSSVVESEETSFASLSFVYDTYFLNSGKYRKYNDIIRFKWNGNPKSVENIYAHLTTTLLRPARFYAFYDILFKFFLAKIYYDINVFNSINKNVLKISDDCNGFEKMSAEILKNTAFPDKYQRLLEYLNKYLISVHDKYCKERNNQVNVMRLEETINEQFERIAVVINTTKIIIGDVPGIEVVQSSASKPMRDDEYTKEKINSRTECKKIYAELNKEINEVLNAVESIKSFWVTL